MRFAPEAFDLPENIFLILRDLIHERLGLFYEVNNINSFADRLSPRLLERDLDSFLDYYYLLKYDTSAADEWESLMDILSVPETFFWREFDQIHALVDVIIPDYLKNPRKQNDRLRIWSAACATGEEPLTIAITLQEAGLFDKIPIEIYASDACVKSIKKARRGIYGERSFRNSPPLLQKKYFEKVSEGWQISPEIHQRIHWHTLNLMDFHRVLPYTHSNFIFCRNVFIYFSPETIRQTVITFFEGMPTPGYLFVGAAESLLKIAKEFDLEEIGEAFVYVKK